MLDKVRNKQRGSLVVRRPVNREFGLFLDEVGLALRQVGEAIRSDIELILPVLEVSLLELKLALEPSDLGAPGLESGEGLGDGAKLSELSAKLLLKKQ